MSTQTFGALRLLTLLSLRNLYSHKVKTFIVGGIMVFGTFLVVLGTALLDSVEASMQTSITSSVAGHLQVYDKNAKDELALFGGMSMGQDDIGRIPNFERIKLALEKIDNVKSIVPMGSDIAAFTTPGELDRALADLRQAVHDKDEVELTILPGQIQQIAKLLEESLKNQQMVSKDKQRLQLGIDHLERVQTDEFWSSWFKTNPIEALEFLDTEVAPFAEGGALMYIRYLGTDLPLFAKNFDRFEVVSGEMVPDGKRGFLFNQKYYEDWVKHRVARELDFIKTSVINQEKEIEKDGILKARVSQLPRQYQRVIFQLDAEESEQVRAGLLKIFPDEPQATLDELLKRFLVVDELNIEERHRQFYELIAPKVKLYSLNVGDTLTIRSYTRSGYLKAVNVKVYGVFRFRSLERSELAGGHNLMDVFTFRDLYGYMTDERKKEVDEIRSQVGVKEVGRANVEDELFGGSDELVGRAEATKGFDEFAAVDLKQVEKSVADTTATFDQAAVDRGVVLNAAIILNDPKKLQETAAAIRQVSEREGLELQVTDWRTASGIVGQFIIVVRIVLYVAIAIIFAVALVIINNSMITATMERVTEIGTMRAIGAQRRLVMFMFLLETIVLGFIAGVIGATLGAGMVGLLGSIGIPAKTDILVFLFAGPRLYPTFGLSNLIFGFVAILVVSLASTLYPARIATRIQPIVAMQRNE